MKKKQLITGRLSLLTGVLICLFLVLAYRAFQLSIVKSHFLTSQGNLRSLRHQLIPAYRGKILDRNGSVLAASSTVIDLWIKPTLFQPTHEQRLILSKLVGVSEARLKQLEKKSQHFVYLKRGVSPSTAGKIDALDIPGLNFKKTYKRFYPMGKVLAQILGFTDVDEKGIEGLELVFNQHLAGSAGKKSVIKNNLGQVVDELGILVEPIEGKDVVLSIDKKIQHIAYSHLKDTVIHTGSANGTIVILDAKQFEVLAMVNYPSFNPNSSNKRRSSHFKNRAVTDTFEPGSVVKAFSVASALDSGLFTPNTMIDTNPSIMKLNGNIIRDLSHYGVLSVRQILQKSSNVGVSKLVLASPVKQLLGLYKRVGFGELTGSGFPGEVNGTLSQMQEASPFVLATMGFGYGLSLTPLQLARAYAIIANQGIKKPVTFIKAGNVNRLGERVFSQKVAGQLLEMLEAVVEKKGTGRRAQVNGYRVAGKTGTSRVATITGYDKKRHIASFVGMAPASDPTLVVAVVIREPTKGSHYGGIVAAPLFSKVMASALSVLGRTPDKPLKVTGGK